MLGAVIGDIVGSRFEWNNIKTKEFEFLTYKCFFTDDTVMSLAIAKAIMESKKDYSDLSKNTVKYMQEIGRRYPDSGYGVGFNNWLNSNSPQPYNSYGNGAAMRVSACGLVAKSLEEAKKLSGMVTGITHNHPEGLKGAEATAVTIYLARTGKSILEIRDYVDKHYYKMNFTLDSIRESYKFNETCQDTVPQAIMAFIESNSFEDAIRNAISIGGDSDTLAAITGSIAEAYYGIPTEIRKHAITFLDETLLKILIDFENKYPSKIEVIQNDISVGFDKEDNSKKINTENREKMIQTSMDIAEEDLKNTKTENEETTSQKLFSHLFEACNILRGPINQDEYKSYVTPILFFKRLSDVYDEETQVALEESGGDEEYASFPENHRFEIPEGCHWQDVREVSENVGIAIVNAMNGIERANPDTLYGVFSSFDDANWTDKNKLSDERLKDLIEHMSKIKVGNENYSADVMGDSYEYLIKKFADLSKKNAGEFYTPRSVVKLMVKILDPKPGDTVYDPTCGTGGMLIEAIRNMHDDVSTYGKIYGQEKNLATSAIARMNLFLHGARDFNIKQGDTLKSPLFLDKGKLQTFDCVIANPPFSLKMWGADQFSSDIYGRNMWGSPTDSSADFAWLQHMVKSMDEDTGRCAVVLPQGVLFHGGKEGEMRKQLVESDKLEAVITLVSGVFYSTGVSACILILNNNKVAEHKGKVCLIDASRIYTAQRAQNIMTDDNVEEVYDLFKNYEDVIEKSKVVSIEDIKSKDYTLSVNSYIEKAPIKTACPKEVKREFLLALEAAIEAEENLKALLIEGGYLSE
ncbi:restriction endonuclease subunit M [Clostridium perfringens]|uniref:N-6 DNA methylase n=1 Tax=Clostridium perfringens TaxID=1502 RepID=UPI000F5282F5|nr:MULTISPECIES: N-6 DNA methylase [Clostridium]MDK3119955.1 N-6 DNA methylase [Clostridium perfringens]MDM0793855.1 N-6 DNA methylase [Clostridium perfringens]RQN14677.1 restriction endonuclease subunit M [Clostridium perfringens]WFD89230.1 N-6 DNA methylase [Clostridium perfringens]HAT4226412.1 N-6 DNA methylase [Clostridium perfringens]